MRELLDTIVRTTATFFSADACAVFLLREDGALVPAAWVGLQLQPVEQNAPPLSSGLRACFGRFMAPEKCRHFMHSSLNVADRRLGELALCSSRAEHRFQPEDRRLLALLARRAATALETVRTRERTERQRGSISRIARTLVRETELQKVASTAIELSISELEADAAAVWLATPEERSLALLAATGFTQDSLDFMMRLSFDSPTLASLTASTRQIQTLSGGEDGERMRASRTIMRSSGIESVVDVPLIAQDQLVGVLSFARKSSTRPADGEQVLVATMADLLAAAILSARLYEESERRRILAENLSSTLTTVNQELAEANSRTAELADLAQQRAIELEATISNIADALFVCDLDGRIVLINEAGQDMIGANGLGSDPRTLRDYLAAAKLRFIDGRPVEAEELVITRALRGEILQGVQEIIHDSRTGRDRYIMVSAAPIRDRKGNIVGAVEAQSDITRLKELDLLKDQFITVAAHEIKTPVTAIKGFAQTMLRAKEPIDPKYKNALETIVRQSDRIDALVRDFLEVSRMRQGYSVLAAKRLSLTQIVQQTVARMARTTSRHKLFISKSDEAWVDGELDRLQEVVMNLLDNAMRYSPLGGDVEVQVESSDGRVTVSVRDEGVGIPDARKGNLFERFYRAHIGTSLDYGGLGVGLYISREIVRRHGGDMWFESQEGKGSTFFFTLPSSPAAPPE